MCYFLGMEICQTHNEVFICKMKYARGTMQKFKMENFKPMNTLMNQKEKMIKDDGSDKVDEASYRSMVGCLMYLTTTRSDILQEISVLSRFLNSATEMHMKAAKRVIRYFKGPLEYSVRFGKSYNFNLRGYSNSDWAGSDHYIISTSGDCFILGSGCFSWF